MRALTFWRTVVQDRSDFLGRVLRLLEENGIRYCAIGGVAVNAYAEPVVTLDLDLVVAIDDLERARTMLQGGYEVATFEHSVNVRDSDSKLQVQLQLDPDLAAYVERAEIRNVLDLEIPVAAPRDLLEAKVRAALEPSRRASKRQKDLADIARLLEVMPELDSAIPPEIRERLVR